MSKKRRMPCKNSWRVRTATTTRTTEKTQVTLDGIEESDANLPQTFRDDYHHLDMYSDQIKYKNDLFFTLSEGIV